MNPVLLRNPLHDDAADIPAPPADVRGFHRRLPGYAVTPLHDLHGLAAELGVGRVLVKDESDRLGLPSFKILGASWATYRALTERLGTDPEPWATVDDLAARFAPLRPLTLATATDGNHGRAVARMARLLGMGARIWVPASTVAARIHAIESEGATVVVSTGGYDDAVRESAAAADDHTLVVSDTAWEGYETVPAWVVEGYSTVFREVDEQLAALDAAPPDVVVVQMGVGAFAASAVTHYRHGGGRPALVGVEPVSAACVLASARAGHLVTLDGEQDSIMVGLNCGTPSPVAWPRVAAGLTWLVAVSDDHARDAMRTLARFGVVAGESGAASLAGFAYAAPHLRAAGALDDTSTVVLFSTEGATDPEAYRQIVTAGTEA